MGRIAIIVALFLALTCRQAAATWYILHDSDVELAASPVVVVGYWPKAKRTNDHIAVDGRDSPSVLTQLKVLKVLHGTVSPGLLPIRYTYGVSWGDDGKGLNSSSSTLAFGDVKDVSKPNIWYLKWEKREDKRNPKPWLRVYSYRCIQDQRYLAYYETLRSPDRDQRIGSLLASRDQQVVKRTLDYVSGDWEPWPLTPYRITKAEKDGARPRHNFPPLRPYLERILASRPNECRPVAAALLARWAGPGDFPRLRRLLQDRQQLVQIIGACNLVRLGDQVSVATCTSLASKARPLGPLDFRTVSDCANAKCELISAMERRHDLRFVPCMICFLEDGSEGGGSESEESEDDRMPFVYARDALGRLTGYRFPPDVRKSLAAWRKVERSPISARAHLLTLSLGNWRNPLAAEAWNVGPERKSDYGGTVTLATIRVTNQSGQMIVVANRAGSASQWTENSSTSGGLEFPTEAKTRLVSLSPGKSIEFQAFLKPELFRDPGKKTLNLQFFDGDLKHKVKPWLGVVRARIHSSNVPAPKGTTRAPL